MKIISDKNINDILNRISANYIICMDALSRVDMDIKNYADAVEHLTDNTISMAYSLAGEQGMKYISKIINRNK